MRLIVLSSESDLEGKDPDGILPTDADMVCRAAEFKRPQKDVKA
jgi:hypothetical protein